MKQELFCQNGQHKWKRERKRGRVPTNCPKHLKPVTTEPKSEPLEKARKAKAEKAEQRVIEERASLEQGVQTLRGRVERAQTVEEKAHARLRAKRTDKNLDEWLKLDGRLLDEIIALRAREAALERS